MARAVNMFKRFTLDNGIRLLVNELPHTRSVTLGYYVGIGSRYESDEIGGVSHFIEHMLFKGTSRRPTAQDIAVAIEGIGGAFNAGTSHEFTNYWVKVAYQHLDTAIDVLSDMLRASLFQAEEIEKERRVIVEEINQTFDTPDDLVFFDLDELMWPGHPLGRDIAGSPETVSRLTRDQLCDYMAETYTAPNIVVSVAGMVEADAVRLKIEQALGEFPSGARRSFVKFERGQGERRWKVRHKKTEQAHVAVSTWSYPRNHPDRFVVSLLHSVLGDGMSSRLFQEIREKRGLAYSVSAFGASHEDCGHLGSYAAVEPRNAAPTLRAILHEWARLRDELVPEDELTKAKELVKGHLLLSMEDTHAVAGWYGRQEVLEQEILSVDDVTAAIDAVQAEDIRRVARDLFRDEWLNLTVVGPFRQDGRLVKSLALQ